MESASALIDERIRELGDWRGKMLGKLRKIIHAADPEIVEEWKWRGTPVFSHGGIRAAVVLNLELKRMPKPRRMIRKRAN